MRILLIGFGTVGQSLARILNQDRDWLARTYGFEPTVTAIVDSGGSCRDDSGLDLETALKVKTTFGTVQKYPAKGERRKTLTRLIDETEADILIETTLSNFKDAEPGLSNIKQALVSGKHVVTTNKGPLALAMPALLELAAHKRVQLRFSGTVGGGTPFLSFASKSLPGEKITDIHGILNGTTNYILTRMENGPVDFRTSLREAQQKGYAEKDPTNDVEGFDSAAKIVIMSNWILKRQINIHDMKITGISGITPRMISKARAASKRIKLIGRLSENEAIVEPQEIDTNDPICVPDTLNAVTFTMERSGNLTLVGHGAGGERTAGAVVRDLVDIRREYFA